MQLTQCLKVKYFSSWKSKSIKSDTDIIYTVGRNEEKMQSSASSVHQFLSSSAILINMLINPVIDLTVSDNCKEQAEIKS